MLIVVHMKFQRWRTCLAFEVCQINGIIVKQLFSIVKNQSFYMDYSILYSLALLLAREANALLLLKNTQFNMSPWKFNNRRDNSQSGTCGFNGQPFLPNQPNHLVSILISFISYPDWLLTHKLSTFSFLDNYFIFSKIYLSPKNNFQI